MRKWGKGCVCVSNDPQMLNHTSQAEFSVLRMPFFLTNTHLFVKTNTQVTNPKFVLVVGIFVCIQQHCHLLVRRAGHLGITSYLLVDLCGSLTRTSQKCVSEERDSRAWVMIHKCWVILHKQNFQFCKWLFCFYKWKIVYLQKHYSYKYTCICKNQNTSYKLEMCICG